MFPSPLLLAFLWTLAGAPERLPEPGVLLERHIGKGEALRYVFDARKGDYVRIVLHQDGVDVFWRVRSPSGAVVTEIDFPGSRVDETAALVAEEQGAYTLEVRPFDGAEEGGAYRIGIEALRPAAAEDRLRATAELSAAAGYGHYKRRTPEDLALAASLHRKALDVWQRLGDRRQQEAMHYRLGLIHFRQGDQTSALASLESSLALRLEAGNRAGAVEILNLKGRSLLTLGEPRRALSAFEEALALCRETGRADYEGHLLANLARIRHDLGEPRAAVAAYEEAIGVYRRAGQRRFEITALDSLGGVWSSLGEPARAFERHRQALELARELGQTQAEAIALNNMGDLYRQLGQPHEALPLFSRAFDLFRQMSDLPNQAKAATNLGAVLLDLGAPEEAWDLFNRVLSLHRDPHAQAMARLSMSRAARALNRPEEAARLLEEALALERKAENPYGQAMILHDSATLRTEQGDSRTALALLDEALQRVRSLGDRGREATLLRTLGRTREALGEAGAARNAFEEAYRIATALGDPLERAEILRERARLQVRGGALDAARNDLETALDLFESLRADLSSERLRATFLASVREAYGDSVDLLMELDKASPGAGYAARALATAERSRARGLLDFLAQSDVELRQGDRGLLSQEQALRQELAARSNRRLALLRDGSKAEEAAALAQEIEALLTDYRLLETRLRTGDPRYAALKDPAIGVAAVQSLLDGGTVLLEYFLGDARSWLWVVTRGSLKAFELPGRVRLEELAVRVHRHLRAPNPAGAGDERADLEELSQMLLGPALPEIEGQRLAVVADGALQYLPFAALPVPDPAGGQVPLVVRHEIVHLPSAAVLREIRRAAAGRQRPAADLAILADPVYEATDPRVRSAAKKPAAPAVPTQPAAAETALLGALRGAARAEPLARLSWSRREAERIAAAAAGREVLLALDFQADRDFALAPELKRYKILHFATHGFLDADHPELSGLALSQRDEHGEPRDGFLRLQDVYGLELQADLVVLSGCETALGRRIRGEGLLGLTHGFLHAGASGVLASLWEVRDRATAELMERFYRGLYQDKLSPAAALRAAQVAMWKERQWRDPYYWAAFTMQGDWEVGFP